MHQFLTFSCLLLCHHHRRRLRCRHHLRKSHFFPFLNLRAVAFVLLVVVVVVDVVLIVVVLGVVVVDFFVFVVVVFISDPHFGSVPGEDFLFVIGLEQGRDAELRVLLEEEPKLEWILYFN